MKRWLITTTKLLIWIATTVIIGYDIVAMLYGGSEATISNVMGRGWAWQYATLPFVWGVLSGHLFWIANGEIKYYKARVILLGILGAGILLLDFVDVYDIMPIVPMIIGIPLGRLLFPQHYSEDHPFYVLKA